MSLNTRAFLTIVCAAGAWAALPLHASLIQTYSTLSALQADSSGLQTITFDGTVPVDSASSYNTSSGFTLNTVNFVGVINSTTYSLEDLDTNFAWYYNFGGNDALLLTTPPASLNPHFHVNLPAGVTSFGVNLASGNPYGLTFNVVVNGVSYPVSAAPTNPTSTSAGTTAFFGATFDAPITSIDIDPVGYVPSNPTWALLDNFSFGTANVQSQDPPTAPEPGPFFMIGTGLVGVALLRRLRRRPAQTA